MKRVYAELAKPFPGWEGEIRDPALKRQLVGVSLSALFVFTEKPLRSLGRFLSDPTPTFPTMRLFSRNAY